MRTLLILAAVLAFLPPSSQEKPAEPVTAARLVLLAGAGPVPAGMLTAALTSSDPDLRVVAARTAGVYVTADLRPALEAALAKETDPLVGAELIRTLLFLGREEAIPVLEPHARRIGGEARVPIYEWLARTNPNAFADGAQAMLAELGREDGRRVAGLVRMVAAVLDRPDLRSFFHERPTVPGSGPLLLGADLPVAARLLPAWRAGLLASAAAEANCPLGDGPRFGYARLTFRPDGRPVQVAVDPTNIPKECLPVLAGLARLALADADRPLPEGNTQWVALPFTRVFAGCAPSHQTFLEPDPTRKVTPPRKARDVRPLYPEAMREQRVQGTVFIDATINEAGCIPSARVVKSPSLGLSLAALEAASRWVYDPARVADTPIAVGMTLSVNFRLQ